VHQTEAPLSEAIERATRLAVHKLFAEHPESFYYLSLITTGEAHAPFLTAWSEEALDEEAKRQGLPSTDLLKWSYADSPYTCYGEEFFGEVNRLFDERPSMDHTRTEEEWSTEFDLRLTAMEAAMKRLDEQGLFGRGPNRDQLVINVEVMPPDRTNTQRAIRLNPKGALVEWLKEAAEK
jgi:hypothetical protein